MNFCCDFLFVVLVYTLLVNEVVVEEKNSILDSHFWHFRREKKKLWSRFLEKWSYIIRCLCFVFLFQYLFIADLRERISQGQIKPAGVWFSQNFRAQIEHIQYSWTGKVYFRNTSSHSAARFRWLGCYESWEQFFSMVNLPSCQSSIRRKLFSSNYGKTQSGGAQKLVTKSRILPLISSYDLHNFHYFHLNDSKKRGWFGWRPSMCRQDDPQQIDMKIIKLVTEKSLARIERWRNNMGPFITSFSWKGSEA